MAKDQPQKTVNFIRVRNQINAVLSDNVIRLLEIDPSKISVSINLGTIACLHLLAERETYIHHFDSTEKRYNGNTLITHMNKIGIPIDDVIIDTFHDLVAHEYIDSDTSCYYRPQDSASALSKFFSNMLKNVNSLDLVSNLTKVVEKVVLDQLNLEKAISKINKMFFNRGVKRSFQKLTEKENELIERSLTSAVESVNAKKIADDFKAHCENDSIDIFEYSQSKDIIEALLTRMRSKKDFPSFYQTFIEVNRALDANYGSASEVANVILKDYSLTNKLLKLVNSAFYGNFRERVSTISQAVILLGLEKVKLAAAGLMFFEQMNSSSHTLELKDACIRSFMSGLVAKEIAGLWNVKEEEQASICAMFHRLGEYIILFYLPEEYTDIKERMARKNVDLQIASRAILGMTSEDLGASFAGYWGLPKEIIGTMRKISKNNKDISNINILRIISHLSNLLCDITMIESNENREYELDKIEDSFNITQIDIYKILYAVWHKLSKYSSILNIELGQSELLSKFSTNIIHQEVEVFEPAENIEIKVDFDSMVVNGIGNVTNVILEDSFELNAVLSLILEIMYQGFEFTRVMICILNNNTKTVSARYGLGGQIEKIMKSFVFRVSNDIDVFNKAIYKKEDIHLIDPLSSENKSMIPSWYSQLLKTEEMFIYPIIVKNKIIGLFYADWEKRKMELSDKRLDYMNILRNQAALAIMQKS